MRVELNQGMYRSSHECCGSTVSLLVATSLLSRYRTTSMNSSRIECHGSFISTDRFRTLSDQVEILVLYIRIHTRQSEILSAIVGYNESSATSTLKTETGTV